MKDFRLFKPLLIMALAVFALSFCLSSCDTAEFSAEIISEISSEISAEIISEISPEISTEISEEASKAESSFEPVSLQEESAAPDTGITDGSEEVSDTVIESGLFDTQPDEDGKYTVRVNMTSVRGNVDYSARNKDFLKKYGVIDTDTLYTGTYLTFCIIRADEQAIRKISREKDVAGIELWDAAKAAADRLNDEKWSEKIASDVYGSQIYENGKYLVMICLYNDSYSESTRANNELFILEHGLDRADILYWGKYTRTIILYADAQTIETLAKDHEVTLIGAFVNEVGLTDDTEEPEVPEDFSFSLVWDTYGISSYDSKTGVLVKTKDATDVSRYTTELYLTPDLLAACYNALFVEADIMDYPDIYDPFNAPGAEKRFMSIPDQTIIITVTANGVTKTVKCEKIAFGTYEDCYCDEAIRFLSACSDLEDVIMSTDEWLALPDYEFYYE